MAKVITIGKDWWKEDREPAKAAVVRRQTKLPTRFMTVKEVAARLACEIWLVYDLVRGDEIDWQPVGKRGIRISEEALLAYLERRKLEEKARRA